MALLGGAVSLLSLATPAFAKPDPDLPTDVPADVTSVKDMIRFFVDGKSQYIALVPFVDTEHVYAGDGKTFFALNRTSGGRDGTASFEVGFWHPRAAGQPGSFFEFKNGKYTLACGERTTEYKPVAEADGKAMLTSAKFFKPWFKYRPTALARDEGGTYYYVDRPRDPKENKAYRVFTGAKGALKRVKLTDVVSDGGGETFLTASGQRLVRDGYGLTWVKGKDRTPLVALPVNDPDNEALIYFGLGVYPASRFGTPCDSR